MTAPPIIVHGTPLSGHTHRVVSFLAILGLPHQLVDTPAALRGTPEFRVLNPLGQVPVIQDGELVIADSNAILVYLARRYAAGSRWLPDEPVAAAAVQRWLSIAAGELKYGPAAARVVTVWRGPGSLADAHAIAARVLRFMDDQLASRAFLAGDHATIADLACYAYVAHAPEGRISLADYPHLRGWLARVEAVPGFQPMQRTVIAEPEPAIEA
ncbi:MAG TPA: glutathione S-transferase [Kofleriaceae bacterium]|nr:glutathione S-transferase [Kofleriaceae bacterium]